MCRNLSLGLVTKAKVYEGAHKREAWESHFVFPGVQESVRE